MVAATVAVATFHKRPTKGPSCCISLVTLTHPAHQSASQQRGNKQGMTQKGLNSRGGPGSWGGAERRSLGANSDLELWGQPLDHVDLAGFSFPLTCVKAERILERKGMMPQTTHRNQKMMRTPEDRTPCSRSYWISRVASSCAVRAAGAGPEHTSGPDSVPPHAPWLDVSGITPF